MLLSVSRSRVVPVGFNSSAGKGAHASRVSDKCNRSAYRAMLQVDKYSTKIMPLERMQTDAHGKILWEGNA